MSDFRSQRMPSPEGHGQARSAWQRAWDAYAAGVERAAGPLVRPAATWVASRQTEDLFGFWLLWQLEGGFEGLQRIGMSRSAIYRRVQSFRKAFGAHPDDFAIPGLTIDLPTYLAGRDGVAQPDQTVAPAAEGVSHDG